MAIDTERPSTADTSHGAKHTAGFFEAVLMSNPFLVNRINDPSQLLSDVEPIHADEFLRLVSLAQQSCSLGRGFGALLLGGAGTGKSHLLARLASWASSKCGRFDKACFVFLHSIHASAIGMSRYLLKSFMSRLVEDRLDRLHQTMLFRIVDAAMDAAATAEGIQFLNKENREAVYKALSTRLGGDSDVFAVVFRFFCSIEWASAIPEGPARRRHLENAAIAIRWLKGDLLDAEDARRIGRLVLPGHDTTQLSEDQIETVLLVVARLARVIKRPVILCVDQVDNMRSDQFTSLCQTLQSLIDNSTNTLVVVSGVRETILQRIQDRTLPEAFADRVDAARPIDVRRIDRDAGRQILQDRLHQFLVPFEDSLDVKNCFASDALFPLGTAWFDGTQADAVEVRPRDVITWANTRWCEIQTRLKAEGPSNWLATWEKTSLDRTIPRLTKAELIAAIDAKVAEKLEESLNNYRLNRSQLQANAGDLIFLTKSLLEQCLNRPEHGYTVTDVQERGGREIDLRVLESAKGRSVQNDVQFIVTRNKASAAHQLRKLRDSKGADRRILVTEEEREPLRPLGAEGQQRYRELQALGNDVFTHVCMDFDQFAMLASMARVIELARDMDLEIAPRGFPRPVDESQVIDSYHRQNRFRSMPLLRLFLTEEPAPEMTARKFPRAQFREFVLQELAFAPPKGLLQLIAIFEARFPNIESNSNDCYLPQSVVRELRDEGRIKATPCDNDIILQSA